MTCEKKNNNADGHQITRQDAREFNGAHTVKDVAEISR
jgi:hypothetical protein